MEAEASAIGIFQVRMGKPPADLTQNATRGAILELIDALVWTNGSFFIVSGGETPQSFQLGLC